ncbi:probable proton-coupled zinc antiporter SLC30A4 isoform X1 [Vulpes vulpes]|uniref:Probable proton-coupled zinc antiporter SLC30A4 isoform X1 n=3 Tax=Vulpes vulpes TaxID=9627 RepID=A0ABM4YW53_VULVU
MAGSSAWKRLKSLLRKDDAPLFLNDTSAFDFSDEVGDEGLPCFNKLRVVVADDGSEIPERPINGAHPALQADDDSLLDQDLPLTNSQLSLKVDPCDNCSRQRELLKQRKVKTRLTIAAVLYLLFMVGELVGGYIANSLAIMTDALHMLTDLSAIILTLLALWLSSKSPTKRFTFGFHRLDFCLFINERQRERERQRHRQRDTQAPCREPDLGLDPRTLGSQPEPKEDAQPLSHSEVLSAMISVLLVYILMGFLLYEAVQRTIHMKYEINGDIMLITAAVGVAVNVIMGFLLNQSGHHAHSHSLPSNSPTIGSGCRHNHGQDSLAVRAAFVHALGDLVQSVGVLIAAYIIRFKPEYKIADPICTYVFSLLVAFTTFRIIWDTIVIILEGVPSHLNVDYIKEALMKIEDVYSVEDLNIWSLTSGKPTAIVHIQLIPGSSSKWEEVQSKAKHLLLNTFGMYKCTIQLQSYRQEVDRTCAHCQSSSP